MDTHGQRRARPGGETGPNGEWYDGGKFIATHKDRPKASARWKKPTGRQQIDRDTWTTPPALPGDLYAVALFRALAGIHRLASDGLTFSPNVEWLAYQRMTHDPGLDAFNAGRRWAVWTRTDSGQRIFTGEYL